MTDSFIPDDDNRLPDDDDISYERFDDVWEDPDDDLDVIDLDALDDPIEAAAVDEADETAAPDDSGEEDAPTEAESAPEETTAPADSGEDEAPAPAAAPQAEQAIIEEPPPDPLDTVPFPELQRVEPGDKLPPPLTGKAAPVEAAPAPVAKPVAAEAATDAEPPIPPEVYRALLAVPPELGALVLEMRAAGEIEAMPPPGIALLTAFRTTDRAAVEAALERWAAAHLPIRIGVTGVLAEVIGARQYVAAWTLAPEEALQAAQLALTQALMPLILPLPDPTGAPISAYPVRVTVGDQVAAHRFPRVIGQMQRAFDPVTWRADTVLLAAHAPDAPPDAWEIARTIGPAPGAATTS